MQIYNFKLLDDWPSMAQGKVAAALSCFLYPRPRLVNGLNVGAGLTFVASGVSIAALSQRYWVGESGGALDEPRVVNLGGGHAAQQPVGYSLHGSRPVTIAHKGATVGRSTTQCKFNSGLDMNRG